MNPGVWTKFGCIKRNLLTYSVLESISPTLLGGCMVVLLGEDHAASLMPMPPDKCP
jgi:hypothetical protein